MMFKSLLLLFRSLWDSMCLWLPVKLMNHLFGLLILSLQFVYWAV
ncbi:hypothetical protein X975_07148, partial [Stegodyphus mimosarum]